MATRKSSNGGCAIDQLEPSSATRKHGNKPDACAAPTNGMPHPSMVALEREIERERERNAAGTQSTFHKQKHKAGSLFPKQQAAMPLAHAHARRLQIHNSEPLRG